MPKPYFLLALPITTAALGTWQVRRYHWKRNLLAKRDELLALPPVKLGDSWEEGRRVEVDGVVDEPSMLVWRPWKEAIGFHLISRFVATDGSVFLIHRGWAHGSDPIQVHKENQVHLHPVKVIGTLHPGEKKNRYTPLNHPDRNEWYWVDLKEMGETAGAKPVLLDPSAPIGTGLEKKSLRGGRPSLMPSDHVQYAATWFTLTGLLGVMAVMRLF